MEPLFHVLVLHAAPEPEGCNRNAGDDERPGNAGAESRGEREHNEPEAKKAVKPLLPHMLQFVTSNPLASIGRGE